MLVVATAPGGRGPTINKFGGTPGLFGQGNAHQPLRRRERRVPAGRLRIRRTARSQVT